MHRIGSVLWLTKNQTSSHGLKILRTKSLQSSMPVLFNLRYLCRNHLKSNKGSPNKLKTKLDFEPISLESANVTKINLDSLLVTYKICVGNRRLKL